MPKTPIYQLAASRISGDGRYRSELVRIWDATKPVLGWVMCNPSTADGSRDDPTIRRVVGFSQGWGYGGAIVGNLYGWRATDPKELHRPGIDPVGPDNWVALNKICARGLVVCAWGGNIPDHAHAGRVLEFVRARTQVAVLGWTVKHQPRHPLYVKGNAPLVAAGGLTTTMRGA